MVIVKFLITFFTIFALTLTLSVDDFSVGVAYGLNKTRIPLKPMLLMLLGSAISTYGLMLVGKFVFMFLPDSITDWVSAFILGVIGCRMIYKGWTEKEYHNQIIENNPLLISKTMNPLEPLLVGLALGVDDFAEALGLAVAGFPIILTVCLMEVSQLIAVLSGNYLAFKNFSKNINGKLAILPGIVLILIGICEIFF